MTCFSGAGKLWLYSGVTTTNASAAASRGPIGASVIGDVDQVDA